MLQQLLILCLVSGILAGVPNLDTSKIKDHSTAEHVLKENHDVHFDHEAFLGSDEARTFDQLPPEESKRRLGIIVDKIDSDKDGFITVVELKDWIRYTQKRYIDEDVDRHWKEHSPENSDYITWEAYKQKVYGFMETMSPKELEEEEGGDGYSYKTMLSRDRRRWHHADTDEDEKLNRTEFAAFLHPEENPAMRDIVAIETMEDIDKDKDGKISVDEYIGDMYLSEDELDEEPEWVISEREQFKEFRDQNKDGFMDAHEVKAWIAPAEFDHAEAEARHLMLEADSDADEKLTKDEIIKKYDLFVGSQATDFGEALARHDEF